MRSILLITLTTVYLLSLNSYSVSALHRFDTSAVCLIRGGAEVEDEGTSSQAISRTMYNKQATNWVRTEPRCLSDFTGRPVVFSMIEAHIKGIDGNGAVVLDVGCGEGYCARKVVKMGAKHVIGCDISDQMIESAKETSHGDKRYSFFACPCGELQHSELIQKDAIDVAMAVFLFNYLTCTEMYECISIIYQVLKPGGIFVFSVPHPSMIYCHDEKAIFGLKSEGKGYFSSVDKRILGHISTVDGERLNIMSVHKTLNNYIQAIHEAGFHILDIKEVGVTDEHMNLHPDFFESVKDRPLHLIFKLRK